MSLNADTLLDRIRLKQQVSRWRLLAVLIAIVAGLVLVESSHKLVPVYSDYIARIRIDGIITDNPEFTKMVERIRTDKHAKAVLVVLDTPGGSAVGGQQVYLDLLKLSKAKPTVAVMRTMAASAGYMAALGTDQIFAREGTITGSIGVIMEAFEATELAEKIGIKPITLKSGPYKAAPNPLEKMTKDQGEVLQAVITDFFNWFVDIVTVRRNLPREEVIELADGRIYTGRQALKVKLIDQLGGEDEAVEWLSKTKKIDKSLDIEDVKMEKESDGLLEELTQLANGKIGSNLFMPVAGLAALWRP